MKLYLRQSVEMLTSPSVPLAYDQRQSGAYIWYVAVVLALAHMISFVDRFLISLVMEPLKADLQISDTQLGLLQGTSFVLLYVLAAIPLGQLADRVNRRNLIVAGILFWTIATAACGFAETFETLFIARIAVGLGEAALVPAAMSLLATYFQREQLGRAVSIFTTGASLGKSAAFLVGGLVFAILTANAGLSIPFVGNYAPWQGVFIIAAVPGIMLALLMFTVAEPKRAPAHKAKKWFAPAFDHIRANHRAYLLHTGAAAATVLLVQSVTAWAPTFFVREHGLSVGQAGMLVGSALVVAGPLGHLTGGYLTDRFARGAIQAPTSNVMAIGLLMSIPFAFLFTSGLGLVASIAGFSGMTFFFTMSAPASLAGLQMLTPTRLRGLTTSIFLLIVTLVGVGVGPLLIGFVTDTVFVGPEFLGKSLISVILVVATLGAIMAWTSRHTVHQTIERVSNDEAKLSANLQRSSK